MEPQSYTIHQHIYNGLVGAGKIVRNDLTLRYFPAKSSEKIVKGYSRGFIDYESKGVDIGIDKVETFDDDELVELLAQAVSDTNLRPESKAFDAAEFSKHFSILKDGKTYYILSDSELGAGILEKSNFSALVDMQTRDLVELIALTQK